MSPQSRKADRLTGYIGTFSETENSQIALRACRAMRAKTSMQHILKTPSLQKNGPGGEASMNVRLTPVLYPPDCCVQPFTLAAGSYACAERAAAATTNRHRLASTVNHHVTRRRARASRAPDGSRRVTPRPQNLLAHASRESHHTLAKERRRRVGEGRCLYASMRVPCKAPVTRVSR